MNVYFADNDGDGYGDANNSVSECSQPPGFVLDNTDCDDANPNAYPGSEEECPSEEGAILFKSAEASAFPVPSDTLVKIEYSFSYDTTVSILIVDSQGKTVHHVSDLIYLKDTSGVYQYDVTYLSSGVYNAIITTSNSDDKLEVKILRGTN